MLRGELSALPDLPPELRQGLFAESRSYQVACPASRTFLASRSMTARSLARVGWRSRRCPARSCPGTMAKPRRTSCSTHGESFISANAATFLAAVAATEATVSLPGPLKGAASTASQAANAVLGAIGLPSAKLDFLGHPSRHPSAEADFSQCRSATATTWPSSASFPTCRNSAKLPARTYGSRARTDFARRWGSICANTGRRSWSLSSSVPISSACRSRTQRSRLARG